jgi:hypothetical protein
MEPNGDVTLVARCGLYCGSCGSYRKGRCPGCAGNDSASWCAVRRCVRERGHATCADCAEHPDPRTCALFHNWISRLIGFVLRSDRPACILRIRSVGLEAYAAEMARSGRQSVRRGGA